MRPQDGASADLAGHPGRASANAAPLKVIRDSAGGHFIVRDADPRLNQAYLGIPARRFGGTWAPIPGAMERIISRDGTVVVGELLTRAA